MHRRLRPVLVLVINRFSSSEISRKARKMEKRSDQKTTRTRGFPLHCRRCESIVWWSRSRLQRYLPGDCGKCLRSWPARRGAACHRLRKTTATPCSWCSTTTVRAREPSSILSRSLQLWMASAGCTRRSSRPSIRPIKTLPTTSPISIHISIS